MKASELRIGNYLLHKDSILNDFDYLTYVDLIQSNAIGIQCNEDFEMVNLIDIEPIELTEEWLIKFGLKPNANGFSYDLLFDFAENFTCKIDGDKILIEQYSEGSEELRHIKYVHQLQNLYFALTGTELEIK